MFIHYMYAGWSETAPSYKCRDYAVSLQSKNFYCNESVWLVPGTYTEPNQ